MENNAEGLKTGALSVEEQGKELLRKLLSNPEKLRDAMKLMNIGKGTGEKLKYNSTARNYTVVRKTTTCLTCSSVLRTEHILEKKEDISYVDQHGHSHTITIKNQTEPVEIENTTTTCPNCLEFIKNLPREELERRFYELIQLSTLTWSAFLKDKREQKERKAEDKIDAPPPKDLRKIDPIRDLSDEEFARYLGELDAEEIDEEVVEDA